MNKNDQEDSEDEDHFLESLRLTEENIVSLEDAQKKCRVLG